MSEAQDQRIADLLRAAAPPARDPVFRLSVLELREQRLFQRRLFTMLAGVLVIVLAAAFALRIGGGALVPTGAMAAVAALASAYLAFRGRLLEILRRFSI
jgi:hypothetical protein